ncbi:SDR family oxidoreductase [Sphingobium sp. WCS2017Hpa-17]|uniref:SDR family NAD(P)-dependent oxidoreductase n=1 Tax=Sphingobium sp. WCS2017Hpa-17 TaxID=3073638 RepID=UPI00288A2399|nr:SDR family oxidoreductase [Sphingobium sp. WCS2017Hpa-17]
MTGGKLAGRTVIVTGGAHGLGLATSILYASEGAALIVADLNEDWGHEAARETGGDFLRTDVSDPAAMRALVDHAVAKTGRLDVMANVAAIAQAGPLTDIDDAEYRRVMAVNLDGVFYGTREAARAMIPKGQGAIINVASIGASSGTPLLTAYCASKAGILGLTRAAAMELAPLGIRVNSLSPGAMATGMGGYALTPAMLDMLNNIQPRGVAGTTEEVARAMLFLASDDAANVYGHDLVVDGGAICGRRDGAPVSARK